MDNKEKEFVKSEEKNIFGERNVWSKSFVLIEPTGGAPVKSQKNQKREQGQSSCILKVD